METKPLKRNTNLVPLSKDHHLTLLFCWKIRQGLQKEVAAERIKPYVQYFFETHLQPHFRQEEDIVFASLKNELVQKALKDHQEIIQLVSACLNEENTTGYAHLQQLADMIDAHVRYEERVLFPAIETWLDENRLQLIGEQLLVPQSAGADDYRDAFWTKQ